MLKRLTVYALVVLFLATALPATASVISSSTARSQVVKGKKNDSKVVVVAKRSRRRRAKKKAPSPPPAEQPAAAPEASGGSGDGMIMTSRRGPARVDFDDRLIQGQTNKSGAIYIFERKSSELHSMVRRRHSFREEILRSIE